MIVKNKHRLRLATASVLWILAGCTTIPSAQVHTLTPPEAPPVVMESIQFTVQNEHFCVTPAGYEVLAKNIQTVLQSLRHKNSVIQYYEDLSSLKTGIIH